MDTLTELDLLAERVGAALARRGWVVATAESCTGGWIAQALTSIPGSSAWFDRGYVTYSNAAKTEVLGVMSETLEHHGAVSEATVREMAGGALVRSSAQLAVAVSGIAGPGGATSGKPVGTVALAWMTRGQVPSSLITHFPGNRTQVRAAAVAAALQGILERACIELA